jgi:hypothetical protein
MNLDDHNLVAFFGDVFAQNVHALFKLAPIADVKLLLIGASHYQVEITTPNPLTTEMEQVIDNLLSSAKLHEFIQQRLDESGKLTIAQTSDTPPIIVMTS